jgi:hypothetical protein
MILALAAAERNTKSVAGAINRNSKNRIQNAGVRSQNTSRQDTGITSKEYEASSKHVI